MSDEVFLCASALYHYIKSFFHEHVNHDSEVDSKLKAYISSDKHFDFERDRTLVLNTVFGSYEDLFCGQIVSSQF